MAKTTITLVGGQNLEIDDGSGQLHGYDLKDGCVKYSDSKGVHLIPLHRVEEISF